MNPGNVINQLRSKGYRVKVQHKRVDRFNDSMKCRHEFEDGSYSKSVSPTGGETYVIIKNPSGTLLVSASSTCSKNDQYCRKVGLSIALGRALKHLEG